MGRRCSHGHANEDALQTPPRKWPRARTAFAHRRSICQGPCNRNMRGSYQVYAIESLYIPLWTTWSFPRAFRGTICPRWATGQPTGAPIGASGYWSYPRGASMNKKTLFEPIFLARRLIIACTIDPCWKNDPATSSGALQCPREFWLLLHMVKK